MPRRILGIQFSDAPSIRVTLGLLVVVCVLPIALVAAPLFISYYEREQTQLTANAINRAKGFMLAVDREFAATESALLALSTSHRLATGDLEGFHHRAVEALANVRADSLLVLDRRGKILLSTRRPYGEVLPARHGPCCTRPADRKASQTISLGVPGFA